jgi:predicted MPP superfamily phosphohydrolase
MNPIFVYEIGTLAVAWIGLHVVLGWQFGRSWPTRRGRTVVYLVAAVLALLPIAGFFADGGTAFDRAVATVGFSLFSLSACLLVLIIPRHVAEIIERAVRRIDDTPEAISRRLLIRRACDAAMVVVAGAYTVTAAVHARRAVVTHTVVDLPLAPAGLDGMRIVQISDLHAGYTITAAYVAEIVNQANALKPDLIVLTGDIVDGPQHVVDNMLAPLAGLRARYGVMAVTGNHEYYWDVELTLAAFRRIGVDVLLNEHRIVRHRDATLVVAGIVDPMAIDVHAAQVPDLAAALRGAPEGATRLLLAHQPRTASAALANGVDLQLSGHLHGGQCFPWSWLIRAFEPYVAGLYRIDTLRLYVSRGTGYLNPPNRLGCPSEIAELTLRCSTAAVGGDITSGR